MRVLILFVFRQYELGCKYEIIFQISIDNWTQNCIFQHQVLQSLITQGFNRNLIEFTFSIKYILACLFVKSVLY